MFLSILFLLSCFAGELSADSSTSEEVRTIKIKLPTIKSVPIKLSSNETITIKLPKKG